MALLSAIFKCFKPSSSSSSSSKVVSGDAGPGSKSLKPVSSTLKDSKNESKSPSSSSSSSSSGADHDHVVVDLLISYHEFVSLSLVTVLLKKVANLVGNAAETAIVWLLISCCISYWICIPIHIHIYICMNVYL